MITEKHPMAEIGFFNRAIPLGKATRGTNFAPTVRDNITVVPTSRSTWLKERGETEFVKVS